MGVLRNWKLALMSRSAGDARPRFLVGTPLSSNRKLIDVHNNKADDEIKQVCRRIGAHLSARPSDWHCIGAYVATFCVWSADGELLFSH